jgi:hypothetical protein
LCSRRRPTWELCPNSIMREAWFGFSGHRQTHGAGALRKKTAAHAKNELGHSMPPGAIPRQAQVRFTEPAWMEYEIQRKTASV